MFMGDNSNIYLISVRPILDSKCYNIAFVAIIKHSKSHITWI